MHYWNIDLHMHTRHSPDAVLTPDRLVDHARRAGLDRIAITDHNTIDGALDAASRHPDFVIIGEEVDCRGGGHVIGLFLREAIPPGLPLLEIVDRIRAQGGIVYAPHPFAQLRHGHARGTRFVDVADVVEVHNARAFLPAWNRRAADAARRAGLPAAAGSDSHFAHEVGNAFTRIPPFHDADSFRAALRHARPVPVRAPGPLIHVASVAVHAARFIRSAVARTQQ